MTSNNTPARAEDAELVPMPDVTDDGLALLTRQVEAMDAAHRLATVLCATQMVPATFRGKPDDGAAAILYGAELGLKPQQALQQVFVVHGQPAVYARTMVALLKAKGYQFTTVDTSDTAVTVRGTSPRGETEEATWTIDRAKKAGYTSSNNKYASDPQAMLYAKAASEVCRKLAPDVLLGIRYAAEDLELEPEPVRATARRTDTTPERGSGSRGATRALAARLAAGGEPQPAPDGEALAADLLAMIDRAASQADLDAVTDRITGLDPVAREAIADAEDDIRDAWVGRRTELGAEDGGAL